MRRFILILILSSLAVFILSGCFTRRIKEKEYITIRDTVITPEVVKLDTLVKWNDRIVYLKDSTDQLGITIERIKNNYIRVKANCTPKKIIVPITKTIIKSKQVIVESLFWKHLSIILLLLIVFYILFTMVLKRMF